MTLFKCFLADRNKLAFIARGSRRFGKPFYLICVSKWLMDKYKHLNVRSAIIGNGINPAIFSPVNLAIPRINDFAFLTSFERGGEIAVETFKQLPSTSKMQIASYNSTNTFSPEQTQSKTIIKHHALSKKDVQCILCESDYFLYPLTSPDGHVTHDTFACSVLEAMSCGAIVVSWDVGCLHELRSDIIVLLSPPSYPNYDPNGPAGQYNPLMQGPQVVQSFVKVIQQLNSNPHQKEALRHRAYEWAIQQTWNKQTEKFLGLIKRQRYINTI